MIIIPVKDGESIDRALKRFKKKFMKTGTMKELRDRREFTKKSVELRAQRIKAAYKEQLRREETSFFTHLTPGDFIDCVTIYCYIRFQ